RCERRVRVAARPDDGTGEPVGETEARQREPRTARGRKRDRDRCCAGDGGRQDGPLRGQAVAGRDDGLPRAGPEGLSGEADGAGTWLVADLGFGDEADPGAAAESPHAELVILVAREGRVEAAERDHVLAAPDRERVVWDVPGRGPVAEAAPDSQR